MADKSFGVKEINLVGASGTPTIDSPNNLNINAVNVAISTDASIGGNLNVSGDITATNISIAGTITYDDVTNVDSIGIVTARQGIRVGSGQSIGSDGLPIVYYGDASNTVSGRWTLGADGTSNYTFTGIGFTETTNDPTLYLKKGEVYEFVNNSGGSHPFEIRISNGGSAYNNGVTNNGSATGTIRFEVPYNAPNSLYYQCTNHSSMGGTIFIEDASEIRVLSGAEKVTRINGNTADINYSTTGSNVVFCTNPSGDITLNVNNIPTTSDFDDYSITFAIVVNSTGIARTCTQVNLNGVSRTIRWMGGSLSNSISGLTTTNGYTIYNFTGINTVGSASTTTNYEVFGSTAGGFF